MSRTEKITPDSVIRLADKSHQVGLDVTFSGAEFLGNNSALTTTHQNHNKEAWWHEGVPCEVMHPGGQWRKGSVKLIAVFTPDENQDQSQTSS